MGVAAWGVDRTVAGALPGPPALGHALRVATAIPVSLVVLWLACRALGVPVPLRRLRGPRA